MDLADSLFEGVGTGICSLMSPFAPGTILAMTTGIGLFCMVQLWRTNQWDAKRLTASSPGAGAAVPRETHRC